MSAVFANSLPLPLSASLTTCVINKYTGKYNCKYSKYLFVNTCLHLIGTFSHASVSQKVPYTHLMRPVGLQHVGLQRCQRSTKSTYSTWDIMCSFHLLLRVSPIIDWAAGHSLEHLVTGCGSCLCVSDDCSHISFSGLLQWWTPTYVNSRHTLHCLCIIRT